MRKYIAPEYVNEKVIVEDVIAGSLFEFIFGEDGEGDVIVDLGDII